jgi:hypothetical protein
LLGGFRSVYIEAVVVSDVYARVKGKDIKLGVLSTLELRLHIYPLFDCENAISIVGIADKTTLTVI